MSNEHQQIPHFRAVAGGVPQRNAVFLVKDGQERQLQPPEGKNFGWGTMGESATTLAKAIAAEIYPEELQDLAAFQIKVRFIAQANKHGDWLLPLEEARLHVTQRLEPQVTGGNP